MHKCPPVKGLFPVFSVIPNPRKGVEPDVTVEVSPESLAIGIDAPIEKDLEIVEAL